MKNFKRISINEIEAIDPVSGGKWKVIAPHPISPELALAAITHVLVHEDKRPKKGSTGTIHFEIKIGEQAKKAKK